MSDLERCQLCYGFGYIMVSTGNTTTPHEQSPCPDCQTHDAEGRPFHVPANGGWVAGSGLKL